MICPHCSISIHENFQAFPTFRDTFTNPILIEHVLEKCNCPECGKAIVRYKKLIFDHRDSTHSTSKSYLIPSTINRFISTEVPDQFGEDFIEACNVIQISPKASAALSRRLLQRILREKFGIKENDLSREIDKFIADTNTPRDLANEIDAIRNIGNFAAHPLKVTNTGEIVDVEPGEAEWLLDVLDNLFEYAFVQPKRREDRHQKLNDKLQSLGKPSMKSTSKSTP